ncbi:16574_t:CDS:1, partial [Racocetra persica]
LRRFEIHHTKPKVKRRTEAQSFTENRKSYRKFYQKSEALSKQD